MQTEVISKDLQGAEVKLIDYKQVQNHDNSLVMAF